MLGADLVGVDLLPTGPGCWTILDLNGAVDFNPIYGQDVFAAVVSRLLGSAQRLVARVA